MTKEGTLIHIDGKPALRFERRYKHPMERVWRAISDPVEMASWFPSNVEGEREVGADLTFVDDAQRAAAREAGEPTREEGPMFRGRVVAYDPPKVFSFTWGGELLRFELLRDGPETVLVSTQILSHQSVAARNGSGWQACLGNLDALLGAGVPEGEAGWKDLYEDYLKRIGPELGTPAGGGAIRWERATHVEPDRVVPRRRPADPGRAQTLGRRLRRAHAEPVGPAALVAVTASAQPTTTAATATAPGSEIMDRCGALISTM